MRFTTFADCECIIFSFFSAHEFAWFSCSAFVQPQSLVGLLGNLISDQLTVINPSRAGIDHFYHMPLASINLGLMSCRFWIWLFTSILTPNINQSCIDCLGNDTGTTTREWTIKSKNNRTSDQDLLMTEAYDRSDQWPPLRDWWPSIDQI